MIRIIVASTNPVKLEAVSCGFSAMFPSMEFEIIPIKTPSGVSDQPMTDESTLRGAFQRAKNAFIQQPDAHYWVGVEGGVEEMGGELAAFAWVVVFTPDLVGKARSGTFMLPPAVAEMVHQGKELGEADDIVFGRKNSKRANGAIGILTGDVVDRAALYTHTVILALVPFVNQELYL